MFTWLSALRSVSLKKLKLLLADTITNGDAADSAIFHQIAWLSQSADGGCLDDHAG